MEGLKGSEIAPERIVLFGGSFNPPHKVHRKIAGIFDKDSDLVFIIPCGTSRHKSSINIVAAKYRTEMVEAAFADLAGVEIDFYDLKNDVFTPTYLLQKRYEKFFPNSKIWHVIGEDIIAGGHNLDSEIHRSWDHGYEIWNKLNFLIITRPGYGARSKDMPPFSKIIELEKIMGSGTLIRSRMENGEPIDDLVDSEVIKIIRKYGLY
ncbi:nicotinate-nicotinamide nucleotide adenylyltransferase [Candidatus Parcubacteria bacterium]|nr:nicotinate-nicotinamide nucleotide adenylyltransferase [Candidatus Parcubacteria bacterium]